MCRAAEFAAEFPITTEVERKIAERLLEDQRNVAWDVATEQFAPGTTVVDYLCVLLLVSSRTPAATAARLRFCAELLQDSPEQDSWPTSLCHASEPAAGSRLLLTGFCATSLSLYD